MLAKGFGKGIAKEVLGSIGRAIGKDMSDYEFLFWVVVFLIFVGFLVLLHRWQNKEEKPHGPAKK